MKKTVPFGVVAVAALALGLAAGAGATTTASTSTHAAAKDGASHASATTKSNHDASSTSQTNYVMAAAGPDPVNARGGMTDPPPPTFQLGHSDTLTLHGFVSAVGFMQDQPYAIGNGTDGTWPIPVSGTQLNANGRITGGDARDTRAQFIFAHHMESGWTAGGFFSFDFYGGFNGAGIVSGQQPNPRLRLAFVSLAKDNTTWKFGQIPSLLEVMFPHSLTHMIFPLGFFWADGGWRYPGVGIVQKHPLQGGSSLTFAGQLLEGNYAGPGSTTNYETGNNAGFRPQYEAKVDWSGKTAGGSSYSLFAVGNYQKNNVSAVFGAPTTVTPPETSYTSYMIIVGGHYGVGKFSLNGDVFTGKGEANELYNFVQVGDIKSHGGWVQAGYQLPDHWGVYAGYYLSDPNETDVATWGGHYLKGQATSVSLLYDVGAFAYGVEWMHNIQRYLNAGTQSTIVGNQLSVAAVFRF